MRLSPSTTTQWHQWHYATVVGDRPADGQNAGPVVDPAAKTLGPVDLALLWTGLQIVSPTWVLGALATTAFGLDLAGAFTAILLGSILGGAALAAANVMGRVGVPGMFLARYALGMRGNAVLAVLGFVSGIGWFAANTVLVVRGTDAVLAALGVARSDALDVLVVAVVTLPTLYLAVGRFTTVQRFQRWLVPPLVVALVPLTIFVLRDAPWSQAPTGPALGGAFNYGTMWLTTLGIVAVGQVATWSSHGTDMARFAHFRTPRDTRTVFLVVLLCCVVVNTWVEMLGAIFGTTSPDGDPAVQMAQASPILALVALFLFIVGLLTTNFANVIDSSLAAKAVWRQGSRLAWASAITVVGTIAAAYSLLFTDVVSAFHTFLVALIIWEAPWLGVLLADYFVVRKGHYKLDDLYGLSGAIQGWSGRGVAAYLIGLVGAGLFSFTGQNDVLGVPLYSPIMLQHFNGGDFSYLVGFVLAFGVYVALVRAPAATPAVVDADSGLTEAMPLPGGAEAARPLITTTVAGLFLAALAVLFVLLSLVSGAIGESAAALPAVVVGILGLVGGFGLPVVVDRVVDARDARLLLSDAANVFGRARPLPEVVRFFTEHAVYRLEVTRAWLVVPDAMRGPWSALRDVPQPGSSAAVLGELTAQTEPFVLTQDDLGRAPGSHVTPNLLPWVRAGARAFITHPRAAARRGTGASSGCLGGGRTATGRRLHVQPRAPVGAGGTARHPGARPRPLALGAAGHPASHERRA